jgi:superoxide dismutase, Cu-Zn family
MLLATVSQSGGGFMVGSLPKYSALMGLWRRPGVVLTCLISLGAVALAGVYVPLAQATADLHDTKGHLVAKATLVQRFLGLDVQLHIQDLPDGSYPLHIHNTARCQSPSFRTSGGVFGKAMYHSLGKGRLIMPPVGILPMVQGGHQRIISVPIRNDGTANLDILLRGQGSSMVLHAQHGTATYACGVITRV